jgi:hypothetical protein
MGVYGEATLKPTGKPPSRLFFGNYYLKSGKT